MNEADLSPVIGELADEVDFFLTKHQVAELLGVKVASLYRIEHRGAMPRGFRFDGKVRWSLREMITFMKLIKAERAELPPVPPSRMSRKMIEARRSAPR